MKSYICKDYCDSAMYGIISLLCHKHFASEITKQSKVDLRVDLATPLFPLSGFMDHPGWFAQTKKASAYEFVAAGKQYCMKAYKG